MRCWLHQGERELLEVRTVKLEGLSLRCGRGPQLLQAPAQLLLCIERNLDPTHNGNRTTHWYHNSARLSRHKVLTVAHS